VKARQVVRPFCVALVPAVLAACYTYTPLPTLAPTPQASVALTLSDQGRVGAGPTMGAGVARVEGALIGSTDSDFTLRVAAITDLRGRQTRWSGETVTLQRAWVGNAYKRRFSRSRTYVLVGALAAGFVSFAVTRHWFGGGPLTDNPGGGGGSQQ